MADANREDAPVGDGQWLRDRSSRVGLFRVAGFSLLLGIVIGAIAIRVGGGGRAGSAPTLYDSAVVDPAAPAVLPDDTGGTTAHDPVAPLSGSAADPGADGAAAEGSGAGAEPVPVPELGGPTPAAPGPDGGVAPARSADTAAADEPGPESVYVPPTPPEGWAPPTDPSPYTLDPVPDSLRVPKPEAVRGVYVGSWTAGDRRRLASLLELADATEINAFVVDVKDVTGEVSHRTRVPLAVQVEAARRVRIGDARALLDTLRAHRIYPIARIVAFKDPLLAVARPDWGVERADGSPWVDDNGVHWVDSFNRAVWDYNIELAREAVALGFAEIQWDYVRFPDVPRSYAVDAVYPAREGRTKTAAIREFLSYARDRIDEDVPMTADVFGITTSTNRDIGIGQVWEAMSDRVDVLLPMVYPSHYPTGSWGYDNPNAAPYQIVKKALDDGVERSDTIPNAAGIRPWLQAFSLGEPEYGPMHIRAQIDATYDAGLTEWVLWHPAVRYPIEAFVDANGIEPWFAGMGEALYEPEEAGGEGETGPVPDSASPGGARP